jgi:predicted nucleotidyltransferase
VRILHDIMRDMQSSAPALAPLFRSQHQLRLLGELFLGTGAMLTIHGLAERAGMHPSTASREVSRLAGYSLVVVETQGRNRLVRANLDVPWYRELRSLLAQTIGPPALLADAINGISGIDAAYIFGSWAARYVGEPGPFPRDIDLLIIGQPDLDQLYAACRTVEGELHVDVNPTVVLQAEWEQPPKNSFLDQVKLGPLVRVPTGSRP